MGMKVWLVILASWGGHPAAIKQMPGMASCRAVASTVVEMSEGSYKARCVRAYRDRR